MRKYKVRVPGETMIHSTHPDWLSTGKRSQRAVVVEGYRTGVIGEQFRWAGQGGYNKWCKWDDVEVLEEIES